MQFIGYIDYCVSSTLHITGKINLCSNEHCLQITFSCCKDNAYALRASRY